jgi:hypothetical protein
VTFKSLLPDRSKQTSASPAAEELEKKAKKDAALVVLRRNFPSVNTPTASTSSAAGRTAAKPQNKTVALMKLKRSAKPADPRRGEKQVAVADRRYLIVKAAESGRQADVWLPKVRYTMMMFQLAEGDLADSVLLPDVGVQQWESTRFASGPLAVSKQERCSWSAAIRGSYRSNILAGLTLTSMTLQVLRLVKSTASGEVDLVNSDRLALATVDGDEVHLVRGTS